MTFYKVIRFLITGIFHVLFRIKTIGAENVPEDGGVIISANHTTALDPLILAVSTKRQIRFIGKAELFKIPGFGALLKALGAFPVHRDEGDVSALKKSLSILKDGDVLCVFPQGTRCPGVPVKDTADKVKGGVGMMAMRSGASVVPVYIKTKKNRVRIFGKTEVIFGEPIKNDSFGEFDGRTKYADAADFIFGHICALAESSDDDSAKDGGQEEGTGEK